MLGGNHPVKKIITSLFVALLFVACSVPAFAQASGETEFGTDRQDGRFASQYVFYDWAHSNLLTRYFWVNGAVNRVEIAFGPTFKFGTAIVKPQLGFTSDKQPMTAVLALGKVGNRQIMYIGDMKWSLTESHELYQKFFVAIDPKTVWQFRVESLSFGREMAFLRIGFEYQYQFDEKRHLYVAPFYDPIVGKPGAQVGFRFFQ